MEIVSEEWLAARRQAEMRFSVGWFDEAYVRTCPVIVVRDASGQITAFANIVLAPGGSDATLDVLRQRADALPGTLEFLLMAAFRWSAARGARCFSLGLTHPLSSAADSAKAPATRAAARLARHLQALHGFRGLRHLFLRFAPASSPIPGLPRGRGPSRGRGCHHRRRPGHAPLGGHRAASFRRPAPQTSRGRP